MALSFSRSSCSDMLRGFRQTLASSTYPDGQLLRLQVGMGVVDAQLCRYFASQEDGLHEDVKHHRAASCVFRSRSSLLLPFSVLGHPLLERQ